MNTSTSRLIRIILPRIITTSLTGFLVDFCLDYFSLELFISCPWVSLSNITLWIMWLMGLALCLINSTLWSHYLNLEFLIAQSSRRHLVTMKSYSWFLFAKSSRSSPDPLRKDRSIFPVSKRSLIISFFNYYYLISHDRIAQKSGVLPSNVCIFRISKQLSLSSK